MDIRLSERTEIFHVPYGPVSHDGDLNSGFVDVKTNLTLSLSFLPASDGRKPGTSYEASMPPIPHL